MAHPPYPVPPHLYLNPCPNPHPSPEPDRNQVDPDLALGALETVVAGTGQAEEKTKRSIGGLPHGPGAAPSACILPVYAVDTIPRKNLLTT